MQVIKRNNTEIQIHHNIGVIRFCRPQVMNALSSELINELNQGLSEFETNADIRVIVVTGSHKAFAAGVDITEMVDKTYSEVIKEDFITEEWEHLATCKKPTIAAVAGYVLGGGCELAMMCDIIIAADNAQFGQPEATIGTIPGIGGTQRLTRLIGKTKAMDLCLTGRRMGAEEAERCGLVSRVVPLDKLEEVAMEMAAKIASLSAPIVSAVKESINRAYEVSLAEGILFERRQFHSTFSLEDRLEGMKAFIEKRTPNYIDQ